MPYTSEGIGHRATDTSQAAAERTRAAAARVRVLEHLRQSNIPLSGDEIAQALDLDVLTVRPRLTELREAGRIEDSGDRGATKFGRPCILWEINDITAKEAR